MCYTFCAYGPFHGLVDMTKKILFALSQVHVIFWGFKFNAFGYTGCFDECKAVIDKSKQNYLSLETGAVSVLWIKEKASILGRIPAEYKRVCDKAMPPIQFARMRAAQSKQDKEKYL